MNKAIAATEEAAREIAANFNGYYYPLEDGTFEVLWREED